MQKSCYILLLIINYSTCGLSQDNGIQVYKNEQLSQEFIQEVCRAASDPTLRPSTGPSYLEKLINRAAGTSYKDSLQPEFVRKWHAKYAKGLTCPATDFFSGGDFLRLVVTTNFREFANLVGPTNRLPLDLSFVDPKDSLTIFEFVNQKRIHLEEKHHGKRFEFQQDEEWKNIMFFYFLFSEYNIN